MINISTDHNTKSDQNQLFAAHAQIKRIARLDFQGKSVLRASMAL
jgi:hypothetical protein